MDEKKPPSGRLGTQMRGKVAAQYEQRGHQRAGLWYVYSPRDNKDIVLSKHLLDSHFILMEANPTVKEVDYAPEATYVCLPNGERQWLKIDAVVTYRDSTVEWHRVGNSESVDKQQNFIENTNYATVASAHGATYVRWSKQDFVQYEQRIANWRRVIAWLSVIRDRSLSRFQTDLALLIHSRTIISVRDIADFAPKKEFSLYLASAFRQVQLGELCSDLDNVPFSYSTSFFKTKE